LVAQDPISRLYKIGEFSLELGMSGGYQSKLSELSRPHLRQLAEVTGDTVYLSIRSGVDSICLARVEGSSQIRALPVDVGDRLPLGVGTSGVAILASRADREVDEILKAVAPELAQFNALTVEEVKDRVGATRKTGFADIVDKPVVGVRGLGVAISSRSGQSNMAIAIAAVRERLPDSRLAEVKDYLLKAAGSITGLIE
jgi:DNA-binding IclR family transcriptional regulator